MTRPEDAGGRRSTLKQNVALLLSSITFVLGAGELVARCLLPAPLPWLYPQIRYRPDPALIFSLLPDQRSYSADKTVSINSRGLRGGTLPYGRDARPRILVLGDSIVFGYGVMEGEDVSSRVRGRLAEKGMEVEILNTGVPSYNLDQEVAFLEQEGLRYSPDWVVVGFCWNDLSDKTGVRVSPEGWLVEEGPERPHPARRWLASEAGYRLRNAIKRSRLAYATAEGLRALNGLWREDAHARYRRDVLEGRESETVQRGWERVDEGLRRLRELSSQNGFRTLVVAFPLQLRLDREYPASLYPGGLQDRCDREGLPFLDLEPAFRAAYSGHESLYIPYDGDHPNARGHDIAAREIASFLESRVSQASRRGGD